jgi:hypothetical protein
LRVVERRLGQTFSNRNVGGSIGIFSRGRSVALFRARPIVERSRPATAVSRPDRWRGAWRHFRQTLSRLSVGWTVVLVAGCATLPPRNVLPETHTGQIELEGFRNIRFWGEASPRDIEANVRVEVPTTGARPGLEARNHQSASNLLAISGGAEDGAFGAGLLVGWSDAGTRPSFDLVTGCELRRTHRSFRLPWART